MHKTNSIIYFKGLLMRMILVFSVFLVLTGCVSKGRSLVDRDADLSIYKQAVIYNSSTASFVELELMQLFRESGFEILGEKEVNGRNALGVRYSASWDRTQYVITCTLEDIMTDKSLATIEGIGRQSDAWGSSVPNRDGAIKKLKTELKKVLRAHGAK